MHAALSTDIFSAKLVESQISNQTSLEQEQREDPEVVALSEALDEPREERLESVRGHVCAGVDEGGDDGEAHLPEGLLAALGQAHAPHVRDDDVDGLAEEGSHSVVKPTGEG